MVYFNALSDDFDGFSTKTEHISLLSKMLALFFVGEQNKNKHHSDRDDKLEINYEVSLNFTQQFAKYLFNLHNTGFEDYIEQLRLGCETAPSFMNYLILCVAVEAEKEGQKVVTGNSGESCHKRYKIWPLIWLSMTWITGDKTMTGEN